MKITITKPDGKSTTWEANTEEAGAWAEKLLRDAAKRKEFKPIRSTPAQAKVLEPTPMLKRPRKKRAKKA